MRSRHADFAAARDGLLRGAAGPQERQAPELTSKQSHRSLDARLGVLAVAVDRVPRRFDELHCRDAERTWVLIEHEAALRSDT
jgi:hypothetical protein